MSEIFKISKTNFFFLYFELSFPLWKWHFEHFIILSNSFLQYIYTYKKVLKVKKVFYPWHIQGCVSFFEAWRMSGEMGGVSLIRTMPDRGGGGGCTAIIWPDILCEWPLMTFFWFLAWASLTFPCTTKSPAMLKTHCKIIMSRLFSPAVNWSAVSPPSTSFAKKPVSQRKDFRASSVTLSYIIVFQALGQKPLGLLLGC
jgi:hypothetical protein